MNICRILLISLSWICNSAFGQEQILDTLMHHLRNGNEIEWENFSKLPAQPQLAFRFSSEKNTTEYTISLRQFDVKQNWRLQLNNQSLGLLVVDGNDMRTYFRIPAGLLAQGSNELKIIPVTQTIDEIEVGEIVIHARPIEYVLNDAQLEIEIREDRSNELIPARITITDALGRLQTTGNKSNNDLAVRPGMIYSGSGRVLLKLPAGNYTVFAGRGFEYGIDSFRFAIKRGQKLKRICRLRKEVNTEGWVSCDTHIHTLEHSGHGDASDNERALTLAGEGIELAVITEHNLVSDLSSVAKKLKLDKYFTSIPGDEVTTPVGHFNYFPLGIHDSIPNPKVNNWETLGNSFDERNNRIIILNHGRDLHNGFRPFDEKRHISVAGLNLDKWRLPANAMEVVNSGALLSNPMQLFLDWFGMMNRGFQLSPAGASDSHDVARYIVGQARTYIVEPDNSAGAININEAVSNFRKGKVMVSFGLLPGIIVNKKYGPGDLVTNRDKIEIEMNVQGPSWIKADKVTLFANGIKIRESFIQNKNVAGTKWKGSWKLAKQKQDVFLVAIAEGAQQSLPFWPIVKPFQPTSPSWSPYVIGCTGAVWIDYDGDGKPTPAIEYAEKIVKQFRTQLPELIKQLNRYDQSVATQAAALLYESSIDLSSPVFTNALKLAKDSTRQGIQKFIQAIMH